MKVAVPHLGGIAVVCCPHDRTKREWTDRDEFLSALRQQPDFQEHRHLIHNCACCENLFVSLDDTPRLCQACEGTTVHPSGPIPEPTGRLQ